MIPYPWTFTVGVARSGIALATAATLVTTPTSSLFRPLRGGSEAPDCEGIEAIGAFCVSGSGGRELAKWLAVAALLVVASGWRPQLTAVPHWWVTFSVYHGVATQDGGDQIASLVTIALIPYCLLHPGRWHWRRVVAPVSGRRSAVAASALVAIKVQMSFLYFQASVAKLSHQEWADGTAVYYYLSAPNLGVGSWLRWALDLTAGPGPLVALMTWVPLAIELTLALTLLTRRAARIWLLALGVSFHGAIAVGMGLWSFSAIMVCCLLILTIPIGSELRTNRRRPDRDRQRPRGAAAERVHAAPATKRRPAPVASATKRPAPTAPARA
jgi:antimicrobial peptide system SdpB family protein